ncbi:MAG: glutamate racemase [Desulfuromonas sp.]|nr:MAG: glutamate racemase [Desulfuromonas sp.]
MSHAIGIFDSGVGGLTVYKELARLLPNQNFVYLGDTGRVPYGTKSPATVRRYAREAANFLSRHGVKMLVVACNTASAVALEELRQQFALPVIGVIEPGAERAVTLSKNSRIGVIGTEGTIKSGAYSAAIHRLNPDAAVFSTPCPLFVPLAEEGWAHHRIAHLAAEEYLAPLLAENIDTLVLGCTHYPLLKQTLEQVVGSEVRLVDSAAATAEAVRALLPNDTSPFEKEGRFYVTDVPTRFEQVGSAFLGAPLTCVEQVELA